MGEMPSVQEGMLPAEHKKIVGGDHTVPDVVGGTIQYQMSWTELSYH